MPVLSELDSKTVNIVGVGTADVLQIGRCEAIPGDFHFTFGSGALGVETLSQSCSRLAHLIAAQVEEAS